MNITISFLKKLHTDLWNDY